jgi:hypothetical protein
MDIKGIITDFKIYLEEVKGYNSGTISSRASNLKRIFTELAKAKGEHWNNIDLKSNLSKFEEVSQSFQSKPEFDSFFNGNFSIPKEYGSSLSTYKKTWNLFLDYKDYIQSIEPNDEKIIKSNPNNNFSTIFNNLVEKIERFTNQHDVKV